MVPLYSPEFIKLSRSISSYSRRATIARAAGLLTAPKFHSNSIRLEVLVHLAVANSEGKMKPGHLEFTRWLNKYLGEGETVRLEDPAEDVFISNVGVSEGNRRIFEGIWESNDYFLQVLLDALQSAGAPEVCRNILQPVLKLLRLSDCVAERLALRRWHTEPSVPQSTIRVDAGTQIGVRARAVTFTDFDLKQLGIDRSELAPFIFRKDDQGLIMQGMIDQSPLQYRPLVAFGDALILALPPAVSPAIRLFALSELRRTKHLKEFQRVLGSYQAMQLETFGLSELKSEVESLEPIEPEGSNLPPLATWLLRYDINKYIHVVLLHDQLDLLNEEGLSSFMRYEGDTRESLDLYLKQVAQHCLSLSGDAEGITLIAFGGLGRGFILGFREWPERWIVSAIGIADILMLARRGDHSVKSYLKCMKMKEWAERQGVHFINANGDFNFYCYCRHRKYKVIPLDLPVGQPSMVAIQNDFVCSERQEIRALVDSHVVQDGKRMTVPVVRFGADSYFRSLHRRPIYASLDHLRSGVLAGVVETARGSTWFYLERRYENGSTRRLFYEVWSGFIDLLDRLVSEVEGGLPRLNSGPVKICLNFSGVVVPDRMEWRESRDLIEEVPIVVDYEQAVAEVLFPPQFFECFQQPENFGEKHVLRAMIRGLVFLHQESQEGIDPHFVELILSKVIGDQGVRVLHLFQTYYPVEYLLARGGECPEFLSREDFAFAKLGLSQGCVEGTSGHALLSKEKCNAFLHKIVDKLLRQICNTLNRFDRASVLKRTLALHEAIIRDRDIWRKTAQAVIALHSADDAFSVAQQREQERNQVALPARMLIEMAVCECPSSGGQELSQWALDELLARAALLIEVATDSDAVKNGIVEPPIELHENGEYSLNRQFQETVVRAFATGYFGEEFQGAADGYSKLYNSERKTERIRAQDIYSFQFIKAFTKEYGLTPDEAVDGMAELMELAVEVDDLVVETTLGELKIRLEKSRGMSLEARDAFVKTFSLFPRPSFLDPPVGFMKEDLYPWRFRRRLSTIVRPLLVFGDQENDKVFYGVGAVRLGFDYLLGRTEEGQLPDRFFLTSEMKKYIGSVNDRRGHAFAASVCESLKLVGWQAECEIQMSELGAPPELGDIDVLAWKESGEVLLIECKRLQLARTVAEIAEVCRRFQGEAKDQLARHVRRITWVNENLSSLKRIIRFCPIQEQVDARLVTNTHVPMRYLNSLPVRPDKIGPFNALFGK